MCGNPTPFLKQNALKFDFDVFILSTKRCKRYLEKEKLSIKFASKSVFNPETNETVSSVLNSL